jgi:hypothetical protein
VLGCVIFCLTFDPRTKLFQTLCRLDFLIDMRY